MSMGTKEPLFKSVQVSSEVHKKLDLMRHTAWGEVTMNLVISELLRFWGNQPFDPRKVLGKQ